MARKSKPTQAIVVADEQTDERETRQLNVKIPAVTARKLEDLADLRNCGKSLLVREAIDELHLRYTQKPEVLDEVSLLGDAQTVALKWQAIDMRRRRNGPCIIAQHIKTTRRTIETWMETDPLFAELFDDAHFHSVEMSDKTLWQKGQDDKAQGQNLALIVDLNAHSGTHGLIRKDFQDKLLKTQMKETILPAMREVFTESQIRAFREAVARRKHGLPSRRA